jgi:fermentation-respiration switch protein FrsA (DUF1100 family)
MKRARTRRADRLFALASALLFAYLVYALAAFALQGSLIFAGKRSGAPALSPRLPPLPEGVERVAIATPSGRLEALYLAPRVVEDGARAPTILFAHGNAELIEDWPLWFTAVRVPELAVLIVGYPGYGRSDGTPTGASVRAAMLAAYDWLVARPEIDPQRVIGYGRSLGGGAVCTLIGKRPLAALVLSSTFTSLRPFASRMLLPGFLVREPFDSLDAVRRFEGPVLVLHGRRDELVPYTHGEALAAAARNGKLVGFDAMHNDCPPDEKTLAAELAAFLREHALIGPAHR